MSHTLLLYGLSPSLQQRFKRVLQEQDFRLEFVSAGDPVPEEVQKTRVDAILVHVQQLINGKLDLETKRVNVPHANKLCLVGSLADYSRLDPSAWQEMDGVVLLGGSDDDLLSTLEELFQKTKKAHQPTILSHLRMLISQAKVWMEAGDIDHLIKITLTMLKATFQCSYAGTSIYRQGEGEGYHVSYYLGQAAPIYPSREILEPGIIRGGEVGQGLMGGIQKGENLSSLIWTPIPDEGSPGGFFVLGKKEGSFQREDLERLMMFTGFVARIIQYVRLRVARRRDEVVLSQEHQAAVRSEKMSSINRLMTSMAHLLNNPLQAIQINLELASREDVKGQKQRHYLNVVREEVERLGDIVADMVDHYRPGQREKTWCSLHDALQEALKPQLPEMEERGIEVRLDLAQDLPPVWGFPEQLRQVFTHLINNAREAMPQGGVLSIESQLQKDHIACMIRDDGKGIPGEHEEHIFDPFYSTKENSHGLGLTVCDNIITQHHGDIELLNTNEEGTSFLITLPIGGQE